MSHADVVAFLEGALLTPGRLRALFAAETEDGLAFGRHLAECQECRREVQAWQAVDEALVAITPSTLTAPAAARSRILSNVLATGVARGPDRILGTRGATASPAADVPAGAADVPAATAATQPLATPAVAGSPAVAPTPGSSPASDTGAPAAGRVWRTLGGAPLPSPSPIAAHPGVQAPSPDTASPQPVAAEAVEPAAPGSGRRGLRSVPGGRDGEGIGFRVFLAVAAAAVFLFAMGAALGGPLGLTPSATTVPDTTAQVELEKVMGRISDLLQLPGVTVAPMTDQAGEPAGAVVLALPDTDLLAVVTRALPTLPDGGRYICILEREGERFEIGYMKFAGDPEAAGDVAYWVGPLKEDVPVDAGLPDDHFLVFAEGDTGGTPLLSATF